MAFNRREVSRIESLMDVVTFKRESNPGFLARPLGRIEQLKLVDHLLGMLENDIKNHNASHKKEEPHLLKKDCELLQTAIEAAQKITTKDKEILALGDLMVKLDKFERNLKEKFPTIYHEIKIEKNE